MSNVAQNSGRGAAAPSPRRGQANNSAAPRQASSRQPSPADQSPALAEAGATPETQGDAVNQLRVVGKVERVNVLPGAEDMPPVAFVRLLVEARTAIALEAVVRGEEAVAAAKQLGRGALIEAQGLLSYQAPKGEQEGQGYRAWTPRLLVDAFEPAAAAAEPAAWAKLAGTLAREPRYFPAEPDKKSRILFTLVTAPPEDAAGSGHRAFHDVTAFEDVADLLVERLGAGSWVQLEGYLRPQQRDAAAAEVVVTSRERLVFA